MMVDARLADWQAHLCDSTWKRSLSQESLMPRIARLGRMLCLTAEADKMSTVQPVRNDLLPLIIHGYI